MDNSNFNYENKNVNTQTNEDLSPITSVKDWTIYNLVLGIPFVGFIFLIVKALDNNNRSVNNWAKAELLVTLVGLILTILLMVLFFVFLVPYIQDFIKDPNQYFRSF